MFIYLLFDVLQEVLRIVSTYLTHAIYDSMWPPIQQLTVLYLRVVEWVALIRFLFGVCHY